jgi:hypothetical protein
MIVNEAVHTPLKTPGLHQMKLSVNKAPSIGVPMRPPIPMCVHGQELFTITKLATRTSKDEANAHSHPDL